MPTGMPSIADNGRPARQRSVARSAAARAAGRLVQTNAPMRGSQASSNSSDCSRNCRGAAPPEATFRVAARYGRIAGLVYSPIPLLPIVSCRSLTLLLAFVVIVNLVEQAATVRLEWPMMDAGRSARIGRRLERLPAPALTVIADDQIAGNQIDFFPVVMHERRRGVDAGRKPQQPRSAAHFPFLVEIASQDFLLDAGGVTRRSRPALFHVDLVELKMRLVHRHSGWFSVFDNNPELSTGCARCRLSTSAIAEGRPGF